VEDLTEFLCENKFMPSREDLEAILRRVDHDGSLSINFDEFTEITSVAERPYASDDNDLHT
jgi:hypothetical protein